MWQEIGKHLTLFEDPIDCGNMIWNNYPDKPTKFNCEGWQVKEVVIVDADFITELKNYMINNGIELPNMLMGATDE